MINREGYEFVTSTYGEEPVQSWQRLYEHVKGLYPTVAAALVLIGKKPTK